MTGFNLGADDYISKPFSIKEVIARVKAVINRTSKEFQSLQQIIEIEGLTMDISKKKLFIDSETINLTKKEFKILQLLLQYRGRIFERYEILDRVWADDVIVTNRTVDVNITRIRKKIGNYGKYIISRSGYGYCFEI